MVIAKMRLVCNIQCLRPQHLVKQTFSLQKPYFTDVYTTFCSCIYNYFSLRNFSVGFVIPSVSAGLHRYFQSVWWIGLWLFWVKLFISALVDDPVTIFVEP